MSSATLTAGSGMGNSSTPRAERLLWVQLTGGPSQLETFDPKPDAPSEIRGPFGSIPTTIPGVRINEFLPQIAQRLHRCTLIRSVHHELTPIHEIGLQLLQTGSVSTLGQPRPHLGAQLVAHRQTQSAVASNALSQTSVPEMAILGGSLQSLGVSIDHGQTAANLADRVSVQMVNHPAATEEQRLAEHTAHAVALLESGTRSVVVNMFQSVYDCLSWDCHADGASLPTTLADYRSRLLPMLDQTVSHLLDSLAMRGLLDSTLVVVTGEMGRTPTLNPWGGRDHWAGCWSMLVAGGGMPQGHVVGRSDAHAAAPTDEPMHARDVFGMLAAQLGLPPATPDDDMATPFPIVR
ncbi:DUF1501 domain-containing protein [Tuwongella immobilis]|uniref:DUF1501 domain-containing protein n=1 Tax=Tuwongella immobilis TaxID=692036 RepID=A0A6C2YMV0_9BACT|nr:DUF1501 domain-containing protein [Tuwongella immobilis]VIP02395.1 protein containing duf1501 : Uncharacterized protein OS=Singulisphaera acidiphila (strain ATCC BAA-1392 / DSM 18658 / VKM B-2454 / MOB10) GN=Sinac_5270 PE=4 SV=1: DUF1501: DUF1501 [Tuwongella immobilis]VTS01271.1 protein containing duf1501 : Uncharacterized protein OS=Singulisphaera acidiphila (strain ATCC BAA-1392 / DSM 18658 / VKM B-2454 / MOB10) GN=Sinac_5270 PE=4 SV=1: DUF1501: DUF1501 [Tuwongella immobilis]